MMRVIQERRPGFNAQTGDPIHPDYAAARHAKLGQTVEYNQQLLDKTVETLRLLYRFRNLLFAAGFAALLVARILAPYE